MNATAQWTGALPRSLLQALYRHILPQDGDL